MTSAQLNNLWEWGPMGGATKTYVLMESGKFVYQLLRDNTEEAATPASLQYIKINNSMTDIRYTYCRFLLSTWYVYTVYDVLSIVWL